MRLLLIVLAMLMAFVALYAIYAALFFGWLTATPLTDAQLKRAQYNCYAWFFIFIAALISSIVLVVVSFKHGKKRRLGK